MTEAELLKKKQKNFRAVGYALFAVAMGLLIARILSNLLYGYLDGKMSELTLEIVIDVVFTVLVQVVSLVIIPFTIYKLTLKTTTKDVLFMSNYAKTDWRICLCAFGIGACGLFVTMFVSTIWQSILISFGYSYSSSTVMPDSFNFFHFLLMMTLTAVLPALCEEFVNRGLFLNVLRNSFGVPLTIVLAGIGFGLFHQHVSQVFYTALMGALLAYLVLTTKSIWPAVIVHFTNNALSVVLDFWDTYNLFGSNPYDIINTLIQTAPIVILLFVAGCVALIFLLLKTIKRIHARSFSDKFLKMLSGEIIDGNAISGIASPYVTADFARYKPCAKDWVFYIGAVFVTVINTLFTFIWGLF